MRKFNIIKVDHIAIATRKSKDINNFFLKLLGEKSIKKEIIESEKVNTAIFDLDNINIETLEPISEDSTISKYLDKNKSGIHHISFLVDNILEAINYFEKEKIRVIYNPPISGASNKLVTFLHPKDTFGILIEISQNE